jgi:hypothetical protein
VWSAKLNPSMNTTSHRWSSNRRAVSSASRSAVAVTNRRDIADFDVDDAVCSTFEPTGSSAARVAPRGDPRQHPCHDLLGEQIRRRERGVGLQRHLTAGWSPVMVRPRGRRIGTRRPPSVTEPCSLPCAGWSDGRRCAVCWPATGHRMHGCARRCSTAWSTRRRPASPPVSTNASIYLALQAVSSPGFIEAGTVKASAARVSTTAAPERSGSSPPGCPHTRVLVATGGIDTVDRAFEMLQHADLIGGCTGLVLQGPRLFRRLADGVAERMRHLGVNSLAELREGNRPT